MLHFTDDEPPVSFLSARNKDMLFLAWTRFWLNGFAPAYLTADLHALLVSYCHCPAPPGEGRTASSPASLWRYYFAQTPAHLRLFLDQFGGERLTPGGQPWLLPGDQVARDLKQAMSDFAGWLYLPFSGVLTDLEVRYRELVVAVWREINPTTAVPPPPEYRLGQMDRQLLAYTARCVFSGETVPGNLQLTLPWYQAAPLHPLLRSLAEVVSQ